MFFTTEESVRCRKAKINAVFPNDIRIKISKIRCIFIIKQLLIIVDLNKFQGKFYKLVLNKNISYSTLIDFNYSQSYKIT